MLACSGVISVRDVDKFPDHEERDQVESSGDLEKQQALRIVKQGVGVGRLDHAEGGEQHHRQQSYYQSAHPRLRGERADLLVEPLARAHDFGQPPDDMRERASDLRLHLHRHDQQAEIVDRDAVEHLLERARERKPQARLLDNRSEFAGDGI